MAMSRVAVLAELRSLETEVRIFSTFCRSLSAFTIHDGILGGGQNGLVLDVSVRPEAATGLPRPDAHYALKVCFNFGTPTELVCNAFANEFNVLARVPSHRNIVRFLCEFVEPVNHKVLAALPEFARESAMVHPTTQFFVLEQLPMTLEAYLRRMHGLVSLSLAQLIVRDVGAALLHLQQNAVVHLDVKTNNVLVELERGSNDRIARCVLADFGTARYYTLGGSSCSVELTVNENGTILSPGWGNTAHLAPELLTAQTAALRAGRQHTVQVDVRAQPAFELAVVAYEVLRGNHPLGDYPQSCTDANGVVTYNTDQIQLPGFPAEVVALLRRALAPNPAQRMELSEFVTCFCALQVGGSPSRPSFPADERNQADVSIEVDSLDGVVTSHRILCIGGSRVGKSSVINLLLNNDVTRESLQHPARTADNHTSNGTTDKVAAYVGASGHILIDTIGLTDPRFTPQQILDSIYEIVFNFRVGLTVICVVVKHDIFTEEEQKLVATYNKLFGSDWINHAMLIVTHYDNPETTTEMYLRRAHSPEFLNFLRRFAPNRIVVGSLQQDEEPAIDELRKARRTLMKNAILRALNSLPTSMIRLKIRNLRDLVNWIWGVFGLDSNHDARERLFQAFVDTGNAQSLCFHNFVDTICLETVKSENDDVYVSKCHHVFHFDCIRVWLLQQDSCPNCRAPIQQLIRHTPPTLDVPLASGAATDAKDVY